MHWNNLTFLYKCLISKCHRYLFTNSFLQIEVPLPPKMFFLRLFQIIYLSLLGWVHSPKEGIGGQACHPINVMCIYEQGAQLTLRMHMHADSQMAINSLEGWMEVAWMRVEDGCDVKELTSLLLFLSLGPYAKRLLLVSGIGFSIARSGARQKLMKRKWEGKFF